MKKFKIMYTILLIGFFALACSKSETVSSPSGTIEESAIVGNWKLDKITLKTEKESYEIPVAPATPISAKISLTGTYSFTEDGKEQNAKWKWAEKNKKIEITHADNTVSTMEVIQAEKTGWTYVASQINLPMNSPNPEQETLIQFANLFLTALGKDWEKETANSKYVQILFTMKPL